MAKTIRNPTKPTKQSLPKAGMLAQKTERNHSWQLMRSFISCRDLQTAQPLKQQHREETQELSESQNKAKEEKCKKFKARKCSARPVCKDTEGLRQKHEAKSSSGNQNKRGSDSLGLSENGGGSISSRSLKFHMNGFSNTASLPSSSFSSLSSSSLIAASVGDATSTSAGTGSVRGKPLSRFSGCYECRMVVDPVPGTYRASFHRPINVSCAQCGETFTEAENLVLHQAIRHAVSELGPEEPSKNIVEIIFQSSWLKKEAPICKIDRILKIHNTQKTISKFEKYRESIKVKAGKFPRKDPRCAADGNELLRFHCATFACSIGANGTSHLCSSTPHCSVCNIIRNGFRIAGNGILTTATSGRAHDEAEVGRDGEKKRAMLVCRVIAGRVKKGAIQLEGNRPSVEILDEFDSVSGRGPSGAAGVCPNLDELYVFNRRAILPCFIVIYTGF